MIYNDIKYRDIVATGIVAAVISPASTEAPIKSLFLFFATFASLQWLYYQIVSGAYNDKHK